MGSIEAYGEFDTAWCPGCGNHSILQAVKMALAQSDIAPHEVVFASGIGQAAKAPHYLRANVFNGLHGRALPAATGIKLANPELTVIAESGDGCNYGEGGNHFLAAIRRNVNITLLAHDNQIYGVTKGQASPTTETGHTTKAQPGGAPSAPFNPLAVAVSMEAGFVARGFSGEQEHLADLIQQAIAHPGFALVDILQPCVSFNTVNTYGWYKKRCRKLTADHDPTDWAQAMQVARQWGETIPIGLVYHATDRPTFEDHFPVLSKGPLSHPNPGQTTVRDLLATFA